jgi:hypothetical protein
MFVLSSCKEKNANNSNDPLIIKGDSVDSIKNDSVNLSFMDITLGEKFDYKKWKSQEHNDVIGDRFEVNQLLNRYPLGYDLYYTIYRKPSMYYAVHAKMNTDSTVYEIWILKEKHWDNEEDDITKLLDMYLDKYGRANGIYQYDGNTNWEWNYKNQKLIFNKSRGNQLDIKYIDYRGEKIYENTLYKAIEKDSLMKDSLKKKDKEEWNKVI